ncbi:uncharacterized protein K02A2.6-like [Capsicum annuum]|uniref:uncharacterized protein K02A2.6-like n=1 Tax=Capsicum annuum TaxID=4072 RepID=UPI001FB17892|nr:uncharacterized protein K02A2.6-like [Capsicum annuum]
MGQHYPVTAKLRFPCTNNIAEYEACILGLRLALDMGVHELAITKKAIADFIRNNLICRFGVSESIITDNGENLNSHLMSEICDQFKIVHRNSTAYHPQMNGVVEAANKNIKKILRKMIKNNRSWHEMLPYALLGYRITVRTSTGATPYLLVYGNEAVIPAEVEIPSLRIIQEAGLSNEDWVRARHEKLMLIDEKRMVAVCMVSYINTGWFVLLTRR